MIEAILFFCFLVLILLLVLGWRNQQVYDASMAVSQRVANACQKDIEADRDFEWRWQELRKTSYTKQVLMFWKPIESHWNPKIWEDGKDVKKTNTN